MASGSLHQVARVAEVTRGTTPATPAFTILRDSRLTGGITRDGIEDEAVRPDRQITDFRLGPKKGAFSLPFTLAYGAYDTELEALLGGTWTTNVLKAGTTRRYFTYERKFTDLVEADNPFHRLTGSELNSMELTISNGGAMVSGSFGLICHDEVIAGTAIASSTYAAASTAQAFGSFDGSLTEGGSAIAIVTELKLNLVNGIEQNFVIGSPLDNETTIGKSRLTGSIGVQFRNSTLQAKFLNETVSSLSVTLNDLAGNSLAISIPRIKYTGGTPDVSSDGLVPFTLPFQALYDSTAASNIVITRTPHA